MMSHFTNERCANIDCKVISYLTYDSRRAIINIHPPPPTRNSFECLASSSDSCMFRGLCDVCSELNASYVCGTTLTCIDEAQIQGNPPKHKANRQSDRALTSSNYTIHSEIN
ncbi:unnamed protein product [Ixodes hexagonus]